MTRAVAQILEEVEQLSPPEQADLADQIAERLERDLPTDVAADQLAEVRRRIEEVESGKVALIPGEEALARVRQILAFVPQES